MREQVSGRVERNGYGWIYILSRKNTFGESEEFERSKYRYQTGEEALREMTPDLIDNAMAANGWRKPPSNRK